MASVPSERFVFPQTVEGLFVRGLGDRMTPRLNERLLELGIDLQKLQPAYPAELWGEACRRAGEEIYPELEPLRAHWALGRDFLRGYTETFMGRAMAVALKLLPPMKVLERMQRSFRTGNNYLETKFTAKGPTCADLWLNETHGLPGFTAGILEFGGDTLLKLKDLKVEVVSADDHEALYRTSWSA